MSADNVKWQVNMGVRRSNLPPAARLIMFVLSDMADAKTGIIPDRKTPSLTDLAEQTGHGESTVKAQLNLLEELGWVMRSRPDKKAQGRYASTSYRLQVGSKGEERTPHKRARSKPSDEPQEGQDLTVSEGQEQAPSDAQEGQEQAPRGPGDSSERARSKPPYIKDDDPYDHYDPSLGPNADASAPRSGRKRAPKKKTEPEPHPLADALCERLAELMVANGCKQPEIKERWRDEARRLLDIDKRPFDKAMALLEWCQNDPFWKSNIHSMPKFRTQYDQLRLRAVAEWEKTHAAPRRTTGQQRLDDAARIAADMRALDEAEAAGTYQPPILYALPPGRTA